MKEQTDKPVDEQIGDAIWEFHQSVESNRYRTLLSDLVVAGKLELAMELLNLRELGAVYH